VALVTDTNGVQISNNQLKPRGASSRIVQTDSQGMFNLGERSDGNFELIAICENGFVLTGFKSSDTSYKIQLQSFGRIEGQLAQGRKTAGNQIFMYSLPSNSL
jgi:hypothetical protein